MAINVLVGNPRPRSRTTTAGLEVARHAVRAAALPGRIQVTELSDLAPLLLAPGPPPEVAAALERVRSSDLLVVASPTYKATYTGLLKVFLDLLPPGGLSGVTAVPVLVMASPAHTLAVDVHLRPLLNEVGATTPTAGLALLQDAIPAGEGRAEGTPPLEETLRSWAARAAPWLRDRARPWPTTT